MRYVGWFLITVGGAITLGALLSIYDSTKYGTFSLGLVYFALLLAALGYGLIRAGWLWLKD
jgi:hypothetical protein